ncbi:MAG: N-acetylglucosamine-6-phosphate deacetylase, partial [Anaerolineaceae bacterium]|nr:N-acetylglucosamine-6-phosphate deacetylase [Anaerolineaceae bacterium]
MTQDEFVLSGLMLNPDGQVSESTLLLSNGIITRISPGRDPGADLVVDGVIVPGLVDLQVNGAYGCDFTNDASTINQVARRLTETGVTAFMPTIITSAFDAYPARLAEFNGAMHEAGADQAHVLGVHLEGPYLNPVRKGAHPKELIRPIDVAEMKLWAGHKVVRIVTLAVELDGALDAVRALREMGIVTSIGHSNATYEQALAGFQAGANWATHLYNAQSPLLHREPGLMGAILVSTVPCGIIVDGIHSHPAMVNLAWKAKGVNGITLVTDCMAAMGMPPGKYELGHYEVIVTPDSARLVNGTLAGSILRMDQAVCNMMAFTGCSLAEAVGMASTTPARLLGLDRCGALLP